MIVGVPKEIKNQEYRAGLTPESAAQLTGRGHRLIVQAGVGEGIGADDKHYRAAGADIAKSAKEVFAAADMIVKVKEPLASERKLLRRGQILFTYLHLAADKTLARELLQSGAVCVAYETVTDAAGRLPLLAPMSKVAGRLAAQAAAHYLQNRLAEWENSLAVCRACCHAKLPSSAAALSVATPPASLWEWARK